MTREEEIAQKIAAYYSEGISKARYVAKVIMELLKESNAK